MPEESLRPDRGVVRYEPGEMKTVPTACMPQSAATEHVPLVSILIPAYNAQGWIRQAIESALQQTYSAIEVIVIDDGSTDNTAAVIESFGDRVRFERSTHLGANAIRDRLVELAQGEWLQFLDADDYLLPDKIEYQIAATKEGVDVLYSPVIFRDERTKREAVVEVSPADDAFGHFIRWVPFSSNGIMLRRSAVVAAGGWQKSGSICHEHGLLLRLLCARCQFQFVNHPGAVYRHHSNETVSHRDPLKTVRERLDVTSRLLDHLTATNNLKPGHRKALFEVYLELARVIWETDHTYATQLAKKAREFGLWWVTENPGLRVSFQLLRVLFGFKWAQKLTGCGRKLKCTWPVRLSSAPTWREIAK